jgi:hypothetical protein
LLGEIAVISNKGKQKAGIPSISLQEQQNVRKNTNMQMAQLQHSADELFENDDKLDDTTAYSNITSIATNISASASHIIPLLKKLDNYIEQINTAGKQFMTIVENVEKSKRTKREVFSDDLRSQVACEKLFECSICPASFNTSRGLRRHNHVHARKFKCPDCKIPFATKYSLQRHQKIMHRL